MENKNRRNTALKFIVTIVLIIAAFAAGVIKTAVYNKTLHSKTIAGAELFS